jgi:hypothetical protein
MGFEEVAELRGRELGYLVVQVEGEVAVAPPEGVRPV